jgi:hypothetical protein
MKDQQNVVRTRLGSRPKRHNKNDAHHGGYQSLGVGEPIHWTLYPDIKIGH